MVIVSTELDEIFSLSDRIAVMYDGRIVGTVSPDIAREDIGLLMAGATPDAQPRGPPHEPAQAPAPPPGSRGRAASSRSPSADLRSPARGCPRVKVTAGGVPARAGRSARS